MLTTRGDRYRMQHVHITLTTLTTPTTTVLTASTTTTHSTAHGRSWLVLLTYSTQPRPGTVHALQAHITAILDHLYTAQPTAVNSAQQHATLPVSSDPPRMQEKMISLSPETSLQRLDWSL